MPPRRGRTCPALSKKAKSRLWEGRGPGMPGPYRAAIRQTGYTGAPALISQWSGPLTASPKGEAALNKLPPPATLPALSPSPHSPPSLFRVGVGVGGVALHRAGAAALQIFLCLLLAAGYGAAQQRFFFGLVHTNHLFRHYFARGCRWSNPENRGIVFYIAIF